MGRGKPLSFERDKVLYLAMELFWQKGYEMTSMFDLLDHMGIKRQSFYNTFGSKEKIFIEAISLYSETIQKEFSTVLDQPGNPVENVKQTLKMWERMVIDYGGCMLSNSIAEFSSGHPEMVALLKGKIKLLEEAFYRTFKRAIKEGYLQESSDAMALAHTFIIVSQGMALMSKLGMGKDMLPSVLATAEVLLK